MSRRTSPPRPWFKHIVVIAIAAMLVVATLASLGLFDNDQYTAVPHGGHSHYVPKDRDPNVPLHNFPQQLPPKGMKIASDGRLVPE